MDYLKIYNDLCESRKNLGLKHTKGDGLENHHIIMRSLGGDNSKDNLVTLTAREHYIAHLLLNQIYDCKESKWSINRFIGTAKHMSENGEFRNNSRFIGSKKEEFVKTNKGSTGHTFVKSAATCAKLSVAKKGHIKSAATCAKLSVAHKGKTFSPEHCAKIGAAHKGKTLSPETKAKLSSAKTGRKLYIDENGKRRYPKKKPRYI